MEENSHFDTPEDENESPNGVDDFSSKEAAFEKYMKTMQPKKKSWRDKFKNDPKITNFIPKLGGGLERGPIEFAVGKAPKEKPIKKGVQLLMDRFVHHATIPKKNRERHTKVTMTRTEEDSQGVQHQIVEHIDYVTIHNSDDESARPTPGRSPKTPIPGAKMHKIRQDLLASIRKKKAAEYKEKERMFKMYTEELELEDKAEGDGLPEDDEEDVDSEVEDEDDEEEYLQELLSAAKEKKRKRLVYVEDEAEDSDGDHADDESEDEDDDEADEPDEDEDADDEDESDREIQHSETFSVNEKIQKISLAGEGDSGSGLNVGDNDDFPLNEDPLPCWQPPVVRGNAINSISIISSEDSENDEPDANSEEDDGSQGVGEETGIQAVHPNPTEIWYAKIRAQMDAMKSSHVSGGSSSLSMSKFEEFCPPHMRSLFRDPKDSNMLNVALGISQSVSEIDLNTICSTKFPSQGQEISFPSETEPEEEEDDDDYQFLDANVDGTDLLEKLESGEMLDDRLGLALCGNVSFTSVYSVSPYKPSAQLPVSQTTSSDNESESKAPAYVTPKNMEVSGRVGGRSAGNLSFNAENQSTPTTATGRVNKTRLKFADIDSQINEENDEDSEVEITINRRKRRRVLAFSDDDSENEGNAAKRFLSRQDMSVDYDDEEMVAEKENDSVQDINKEDNERVEMKPNRKGLIDKHGRLRKKFFENEAELSGSDVGSEDEDEHGMDVMDQESGDEEEFDEEEVQHQIERAHRKQLLDDDDRHLNYLQEEYLERGDLHDEKGARQRKFRWANVDDGLADDSARMGSDDENGNMDIEVSARRQEVLERNKWMHENSQLLESSQDVSQISFLKSSKFLRAGKSALKSMSSFNDSSGDNTSGHSFGIFSNPQSEDDSSVRKSRAQSIFASPDDPLAKFLKGSFLTRGSPVLNRLSGLGVSGDQQSTGTKGFTFTISTPPGPSTELKEKSEFQLMGNANSTQGKFPLRRSGSTVQSTSEARMNPPVDTPKVMNKSIFKWI